MSQTKFLAWDKMLYLVEETILPGYQRVRVVNIFGKTAVFVLQDGKPMGEHVVTFPESPAQYLLDHKQPDQAQAILAIVEMGQYPRLAKQIVFDTKIWKLVADEILQLARLSNENALGLGFSIWETLKFSFQRGFQRGAQQ